MFIRSTRITGRAPAVLFSACMIATVSLSLSGCGGGSSARLQSPDGTRLVTGSSQVVSGATVATWARLDSANTVLQAGVTLPLSVIRNPPSAGAGHDMGGDMMGHDAVGPAGAFVVVDFPDAVKSTTFLNHYEMHWNPQGHPPERYLVPHFDLHFYDQTPAQVAAVTAPDSAAPSANRVPAGYTYPGVEQTVPQMGVHALANSEFAPGIPPFSATMVLGYYAGRMTFVEPMITQEKLLTKETITLAIARPEALGQTTRYPTKFTAVYHPELDAYQCTLSDFVTMTQ